jgi:hypothetical protein
MHDAEMHNTGQLSDMEMPTLSAAAYLQQRTLAEYLYIEQKNQLAYARSMRLPYHWQIANLCLKSSRQCSANMFMERGIVA